MCNEKIYIPVEHLPHTIQLHHHAQHVTQTIAKQRPYSQENDKSHLDVVEQVIIILNHHSTKASPADTYIQPLGRDRWPIAVWLTTTRRGRNRSRNNKNASNKSITQQPYGVDQWIRNITSSATDAPDS